MYIEKIKIQIWITEYFFIQIFKNPEETKIQFEKYLICDVDNTLVGSQKTTGNTLKELKRWSEWVLNCLYIGKKVKMSETCLKFLEHQIAYIYVTEVHCF